MARKPPQKETHRRQKTRIPKEKKIRKRLLPNRNNTRRNKEKTQPKTRKDPKKPTTKRNPCKHLRPHNRKNPKNRNHPCGKEPSKPRLRPPRSNNKRSPNRNPARNSKNHIPTGTKRNSKRHPHPQKILLKPHSSSFANNQKTLSDLPNHLPLRTHPSNNKHTRTLPRKLRMRSIRNNFITKSRLLHRPSNLIKPGRRHSKILWNPTPLNPTLVEIKVKRPHNNLALFLHSTPQNLL